MAKILIDLDSKADADAAVLAAEILRVTANVPGATFKLEYDGSDLYLEGEFAEPAFNQIANVPSITLVIEVSHKYTYLHYVDDHGIVRVGGKVVVEAANGGHWTGNVTHVWPSVEEYLEDHDGEPTLVVEEVIDPGPTA